MAARALGKIGNPRAIGPIAAELARETGSLHVVASLNKALLRLDAREHADLVVGSLSKLTNREERYELMTILCEWLGIPYEWLLRSASHVSWAEALRNEIERRPRRWQRERAPVIEAFDRRDWQRIAANIRKRVGERKTVDATVAAVGVALDNAEEWQSVTTLAAAWLLFEEGDVR